MNKESVKRYLIYKFGKKELRYPSTKNLFYLRTRINAKFNLKLVNNLRDKNRTVIAWVKYEVILTNYLNEQLRAEGLSDQLIRVIFCS